MSKQNIKCDISVKRLDCFSGQDISLLPNETYVLTIDYPFNKEGEFKIKTSNKGMGFFGLLSHIYKSYIKQYENAENDDDNGYWHGIGDLVIEGIHIDHSKKTITLDIGS